MKNPRKLVMLLTILIIITIVLLVVNIFTPKQDAKMVVSEKNNEELQNNTNTVDNKTISINLDWKLTLANEDNPLEENFEPPLSNIDEYRQFDSRAISYLTQMMQKMREDKIENIWVQSAYRSIQSQKEVFDKKVNTYIQEGKTKKQAEELTKELINLPGCSDHNLALAVDFNYVNREFEELAGFKWLKDNAEEYGFILRYPKDKEEITKIEYEPWHWRYVGKENAKIMNERNMCLEEYVKYLKEQV